MLQMRDDRGADAAAGPAATRCTSNINQQERKGVGTMKHSREAKTTGKLGSWKIPTGRVWNERRFC